MHLRNAALLILLFVPRPILAQEIVVRGRVLDWKGGALADASVRLTVGDKVVVETRSGADGEFALKLGAPGEFTIKADANGFRTLTQAVSIRQTGNSPLVIVIRQLAAQAQTVTVTADVNETDALTPDPAEKVFVRQNLLDANPGRPGAPVSIPGYPIETSSSGIKAPQYFAPGVAGDHGEPIAQYVGVGSYLVPNRRSSGH